MQQSKMFITRLLPTCVALMALLLAACGGTTATTTTTSGKAPAAQQVLNMPFSDGISDIKTFDPALSTDCSHLSQAIDLVFTGLVQLNNNLAVQPQLASSYQVGSDG